MFTLLKSFGWFPRTTLDIGGYKGFWTREIQNTFPGTSVIVVEPNHHPELLSLGVPVYYEILASEEKDVNWFSNMTTGDSIYKENTRHYDSVIPTIRRTTTLDALFPTQTFEFVKLDCQGAELDVLQGGRHLLEKTECLLLECSFAGEYNHGAPKFVDYMTYLDSIGFSPLDIPELHRANGVLCQIDIVFLRKTSPLWTSIQQRMITN